MTQIRSTDDQAGELDRRTLLKLTGVAAGGTVAMSGVVSAKRGNDNRGGKSGGRGQTSDPVFLDEPFTVSDPDTVTRNASCMSGNSARQKYLEYSYEYCDSGLQGGTICVIPDDSALNEDRVYEFRSEQACRDTDSTKVSFGPSNSEC